MAKEALNKVAKALKNNRILMIVCVFVVMGLAVALIQFLQEKTLERFTSAWTVETQGGTSELTEGEHGELHADGCIHDNTDGKHTCGHAHGEDEAKKLKKAKIRNPEGTNEIYTVGPKGSLSGVTE